MSSTDRQSRIIASEDWKKIYQSFRNADFQSYDFDNLRRTMINYLRQNYPEDFNDYIESSEYLAIIDMIAFLGQNLSFRIDLNARENFLETAERRESVLRLARLISYNPSRNKSANGLLKFEAVSTTENIKDSTGLNLANVTINWNDRSNSRYFEQFVKIINASLPSSANIGNPANTDTVDGVITEQYRFNGLNTDVPIFNFTKNIEGLPTRFEIVSTAVNNGQIVEESPLPGNSPSFLYRDDGQGAGSSNTGFFMHFRQGTLENSVFNITNPVPNQVVEIDNVNINNSDIWLYRLDSNGIENSLWTKLDSVEGNNIIYNSLFEKIKTVYAAITRVEDRINLIFSDGVFGELPSGNFRIYYRTSDNRNMVIAPSAISIVKIQIPYISINNTQEFLTVSLSLKTTVDNSETSQTTANIKSNAPATYYTQNRLVTGEDYNVGPLGLDQNIIKTKTTNRISSGISKYFDLTDPTGKYSTTSVFGTDGIVYKQEYVEKINFKFVTQSDIEGAIYDKIEPIIASINTKNFYQENFNRANTTDLNAVWRQTTYGTNVSTGYFQQVLDFTQIFTIDKTQSIYEVGSFSLNSMKFIETGAICRFVPPSGYYFTSDGKLKQGASTEFGARTYMWATVQRVVEDGTTISAGLGPIFFNEIIPEGAILAQILSKYSRTIVSDVKRQIIDRAFSYKEFGLRYDQNDRQWKLITAENINTFEAFSLQREGSDIGRNQDSSWIFYFQTDGFQYTVTYRNLRYVFESANEVRFFFDSADKIYDPKLGKILKDKITILGINRKPNSLEAFNQDFDWTISDAYKDSEGYGDTRKIQVNFFDKDDDGIADNPDVFYDIIDEFNTPIESRFVFQKKYSTYNRVEDYRYFDNINNTIKIRRNEQINPIVPSQEVEGQVFYFVDFDLFKVLNKTENNMTVTTEYRAFIGRDNLKFHYVHVADSNYRIDPAKSNIMDTYILTKSYDNETRKYIRGAVAERPLPPSTDELFRNYGSSINKIKSISDEIVFHPVKYKILFGEKADKRLQVIFKIIKNDRISLNNNQLKADVVNLITQFFDIENWDFGDTFYFQELSSYIMSKLGPQLLSIVIVPRQPDQVFGSLFEIKSESDEIFISNATVNDIEIIDEHTSSNLQTTGKVITSISGMITGVQTRSSSGTTLLPSSTANNPNIGNIQNNTGLGNTTPVDDFVSIIDDNNQIDIGNVDPITPTFSLSGPTNVNEGASVTINLATTDVPDGTRIGYNITGATLNDIVGAELSGSFTVIANSAFINFVINNDLENEGTEAFTITLNNGEASHTVIVKDTSIPTINIDPGILAVSNTTGSYPSVTTITLSSNTLRIISDGDPFPAPAGIPLSNDGTAFRGFTPNNVFSITDQTHDFSIDYRAGTNTNNPHIVSTAAIGITLTGVLLYGPSAGSSTLPGGITLPAQGFEFDAVRSLSSYGADAAGGYPASTGEYRYKDGKFLYNAWTNNKFVTSSSYFSGTKFNIDNTRHPDGHSKIIGFMFDGYPIYGPFGYINPLNNTEGITQQLSSYRLKVIESTGRGYTYTQEPAGTFIQDYEFTQGFGTLDEYNGKYTKTPDYPNGTYAYFLTFVDGELSTTAYPYIAGIQTKEQRLTNVSLPPPSQGSTYTVNVTNNGSGSYQLSGVDKNGVVSGPNATVTMNTGDTINFSVNVTGHPFYVKISQTTGTGGLVTNPPAIGQGSQVGTVSWTPTMAGTYYYVCQFHGTMVGEIIVQ